VKIDNISIQGFRGFNEKQVIDFHPLLTLIYGPNSYGKTSITEAAEWLLYGSTSKVDRGEFKEEYKGSYRNCHLDVNASTFVKLNFSSPAGQAEFESELVGEDAYNRRVDGNPVEHWPIDTELATTSRPFIMQHALKYLLLVAPDQRFKGFARLLGLDELGTLQEDFVSICTKPEASISPEVVTFRSKITALERGLAAHPALNNPYSLFKKGKEPFTSFTTAVFNECRNLVPEGAPDESVLPNLLRIRDESVKRVFSGSITLTPYSAEDRTSNSADLEYFAKFVSEDLISQYRELVAFETRESIIRYSQFYDMGVEFLAKQPNQCPFCGQNLTDSIIEHIKKKHQEAKSETERSSVLLNQRQYVNTKLLELEHRLESCQQRHVSRLMTFLSLNSNLDQLGKILLPKHKAYFDSVREAISLLQKVENRLNESYGIVTKALHDVQLSVQESKEDAALISQLSKELLNYSSTVSTSSACISAQESPMLDANEILKHELDLLAGTADITLLIDLNENQKNIKKLCEIDSILAGLKDLRKTVEQYVGNKMLDAVSNEMTVDVMDWYRQIRTTGDPDVHFSGFDMDRTKKGTIKSRRVQIKASSYGKDLVSAVSSLSESKLNALGLCLSIATNLKPGCPFNFLFIDDPIQSWDEEHAAQFIEIMRDLVKKGKQVILLTHNKKWLDQVRTGCRSFNGFYYEITSYSKSGPNIVQKPWCSWTQRLDEIDAILKAETADTVRLQQAEEEVRLAVTDLTSALYYQKKGVHKDANKLNARNVRKCLVECNLPADLIDRIDQTFQTTADAHHITDYSPHRERIRRYHSYVHELAKTLE
jgi:hypothetical protein